MPKTLIITTLNSVYKISLYSGVVFRNGEYMGITDLSEGVRIVQPFDLDLPVARFKIAPAGHIMSGYEPVMTSYVQKVEYR